jgi:hypothetical protein
VWRYEGSGTADSKNGGLKRQLFTERLRELVVYEGVADTQPQAEAQAQSAMTELQLDEQQHGSPYTPFGPIKGADTKPGAGAGAGQLPADGHGGNHHHKHQQQQVGSGPWDPLDGLRNSRIRPHSAPGGRGLRPRHFSKIHVPQRGYPLKKAYYQDHHY